MEAVKNKIVVVFSSHLGDSSNEAFKKHIHQTIGVEHKVVCYENYNERSLSEIYDQAISEHYDHKTIMVFCHSDIVIKTKDWGKTLLNHFNRSNYGIIGVAGTTYLSETGRWWENQKTMCGIVEHTDGEKTWVNSYSPPISTIKPVVCVDGLFTAIDYGKVSHDYDNDFGKFHFYDVGFCLPNYLEGVNIGVITGIRILHKSIGVTNSDWEVNRIKFAEKYKDDLPISVLPKFGDFNISIPNEPKVTVIIPTKNNYKLLYENIYSWAYLVQYKNYEIIIADTGSDEDVIKQYDEFLSDKIKLVKYDYYNFAKINNDVVTNHVSLDTELLVFCNDDIELLNDAVSRCVQVYLANKKNVGTIGIRLHYMDGSVQHCGMFLTHLGNKVVLTHNFKGEFNDYPTTTIYNSVGNTGAFMMMNKDLFIEMGMFNEQYSECFEDVELNLNCLINRKNNITVCDAVAYHYESASRKQYADRMSSNVDKDYVEVFTPFFEKNKTIISRYFGARGSNG